MNPGSRLSKAKSKIWLCAALAAIVLATGLFLFHKKEDFKKDFVSYIERRVMEIFGLNFTIDEIRGDPRGWFVLKGISIASSGENEMILFEAEHIDFKYRLSDFFRKRFAGEVRIVISRPVFYANIPFGMKKSSAGEIQLFSKLLNKIRRNTILTIQDGTVAWVGAQGDVSGIEGSIRERSFVLSLTLNHIKMGNADLSTQLEVKGSLESEDGPQALIGSVATRGTVVNWRPIEKESSFDFLLSQDGLKIQKASFFGGIHLEGELKDFLDTKIEMSIQTIDYPVSWLEELIPQRPGHKLSGKIDMELDVEGALFQPMIQGSVLLKNSAMGERPIRNMDLDLRGIYPEVSLEVSRIVLMDGMVLKMADEVIEFKDLFNSGTYRRLIRQSEQKDVIFGDWRLSRTEADRVSLETEIGTELNARYGEDDGEFPGPHAARAKDDDIESAVVESDSLKLEMKDDHDFLGIEKKFSF